MFEVINSIPSERGVCQGMGPEGSGQNLQDMSPKLECAKRSPKLYEQLIAFPLKNGVSIQYVDVRSTYAEQFCTYMYSI